MGIYALGKDDIFIQNDFIDEITEDPEKVLNYTKDSLCRPYDNYEILFNVAKRSIKGYKVYDFIVLENALKGEYNIESVINRMMNDETYYEYIFNVIDRKDKFLQAYLYTYFNEEEFENCFESMMDVAKALVNEGDYLLEYRLNALCDLVKLHPDSKTTKYIRNNILKLLDNDDFIQEHNNKEDIKNYKKILMKRIDDNERGIDIVIENRC